MSDTGFTAVRTVPIPSLNLTFEEYLHERTRARHFHLSAQDDNNAFLVAFLTVPEDSTGIAHILEHTSLCGSERYPVRDPFFMMIRRSLNTFMNAFTASDWTAYPFASQNRRDFDNLLEVYLDAVFFPLLDPLDFAQEGHRVEFTEPGNPHADLVYKGVVFNEMKGAMSSPISQVAHELQARIFPTVTYHHNSGGDPTEIPRLTHQALKAFHARHYHPSNAVFMTYGSFPCEEHQQRIEKLALSRFETSPVIHSIPDEKRFTRPIAVTGQYALEVEDPNAKAHVLLGWLLNNTTDIRANMRSRLLAGVLLEHSASALRHALETTPLGSAPSELCGLDDSTREATFTCGLEGCDENDADAVEALVLGVLETIAREGVPQDTVASVLHQVELAQREVSGGGFPYGLQLIVRSLSMALYGGDPAAALDIDQVLDELRVEAADPAFIPSLTRRLLLDNPHRVLLTMVPDPELSTRTARAEQDALRKLRESLGPEGLEVISKQTETLKARQEAEDDPELLPKVGIEDVPPDLRIPEGEPDPSDSRPITWFKPATNGLTYVQLIADLPALDAQALELLPLYCDFITDLGCGSNDYLVMQAQQAAVTGGVRARTSLRTEPGNLGSLSAYFVLAGKALSRNQDALIELLHRTYHEARFDELKRIRELVTQARVHAESQISDHGHSLALLAAAAGTSPCGALEHTWGGFAGVCQLKALDIALEEPANLEALSEALTRLHRAVASESPGFLVVTEAAQVDSARKSIDRHWDRALEHAPRPDGRGLAWYTRGFEPTTVHEAWTTNTQVNFCAKVYPAVPQDHPDAPALRVLGPFLRNGYLHRAIREQGGAYGAGAGYSPDTGSFRFFSYRDPRIADTFDDFDRAVDWLLSGNQPRDVRERLREEAILGVIGEIDRPDSPAGEAVISYFGSLHGRSPANRRQFRTGILGVSLDDLRAVTERYLVAGNASAAVLSNASNLADVDAVDGWNRFSV